LSDSYRTNNSVEGWHRSLHHIVGSNQPTIWRFFESLRKVQRKQEFILAQHLAGSAPPLKKKKYRDYNIRLKKVVQTYNRDEILVYLENVASNLSFYV